MDKTYTLDLYFEKGSPSLLFNIEDINHETPYDPSIPHRHDYYTIYLYEEGEGSHTIDFKDFTFTSGSISMLFPQQIHRFVPNAKLKGKVLMFTEEIFCSEMLRKELRAYCIDLQKKLNHIQLTKEQFQEIHPLFSMISDLFSNLNVMRMEQFRHLIKLVILKLMDFSKSKELDKQETSESNVYFNFTNLVDDHFKEKRLVIEYAELLGLSTKKLNSISKKYGGLTALQVIHERIFKEAKVLLAFSGLSHKEIAYELHFDSPSALNKFIQAKANCTPSELQKRLTQIYK